MKMTPDNLLTRDGFRDAVFERDGMKCVCCGLPATAAHHLIERDLWIPYLGLQSDGGYYLDNGVSLCDSCHIQAEYTVLDCETLRANAGIPRVILPEGYSPDNRYDKWGNIILGEIAIKGPIFDRMEPFLDRVKLPYRFLEWDQVTDIIKYPRTRHIMGSGLQKDDLDDYVGIEELRGRNLVIEEKIDGANTGVSFADCELKLQCRGHFLGGGRDWAEFDQFKVWGNAYQEELFDLLDNRYIMYGEWMVGFHSVYYDLLPHYFMEFDIYDKQDRVFLSTDKRAEFLARSKVPISAVRVIQTGVFSGMEEIVSNVGVSAFISEQAYQDLEAELTAKNVKEKDVLLSFNKNRLMEGLYIKWEEEGIVKGRYKYVRPDFVQAIMSSGQHWKERAPISNRLKNGYSMFGGV